MKKILLLLIFVFVSMASAIAAEHWVKFEDKVYVDTAYTKEYVGDFYYLRWKVYSGYSGINFPYPLFYQIREDKIDCKNGYRFPQGFENYNYKNIIYGKYSRDQIYEKYRKIEPDSVEYRIQQKLCKGLLTD